PDPESDRPARAWRLAAAGRIHRFAWRALSRSGPIQNRRQRLLRDWPPPCRNSSFRVSAALRVPGSRSPPQIRSIAGPVCSSLARLEYQAWDRVRATFGLRSSLPYASAHSLGGSPQPPPPCSRLWREPGARRLWRASHSLFEPEPPSRRAARPDFLHRKSG